MIRGALGDLLCEPSPTCRIVQAEGQRALPHVPYGIGQEDPRPGDTCESWGMLSWKLKVSHSVVSMDCSPPASSPPGSSVHGILPKIAGVGSHSLLPGVFPTQGLNPGLLHCRRILYHLSRQGDTTKSCRRCSRLTSLWSGKEAGVWWGSERREALCSVGQGPVEPSRFRCLSVRLPAVHWHLMLALNLTEDSWILSIWLIGYLVFRRIILIYMSEVLKKDSFLLFLFVLFCHLFLFSLFISFPSFFLLSYWKILKYFRYIKKCKDLLLNPKSGLILLLNFAFISRGCRNVIVMGSKEAALYYFQLFKNKSKIKIYK